MIEINRPELLAIKQYQELLREAERETRVNAAIFLSSIPVLVIAWVAYFGFTERHLWGLLPFVIVNAIQGLAYMRRAGRYRKERLHYEDSSRKPTHE